MSSLSLSLLRHPLHSGWHASSTTTGLALRLKPTQQLRTYYGKRVLPPRFQPPSPPRAIARVHAAKQGTTSGSTYRWIAAGGLVAAVGLQAFTAQQVACDSARPYVQPQPGVSNASGPILQKEPQSSVNIYQLSFGTVCGICAGVFIKKGAKLIAFVLGGIFVLLQYFSSQRLVTVNWKALGNRYDRLVDRAAGSGEGAAASGYAGSTAQRLWTRGTHFLVADFQPRATFLAGLVLGLRLG